MVGKADARPVEIYARVTLSAILEGRAGGETESLARHLIQNQALRSENTAATPEVAFRRRAVTPREALVSVETSATQALVAAGAGGAIADARNELMNRFAPGSRAHEHDRTHDEGAAAAVENGKGHQLLPFERPVPGV